MFRPSPFVAIVRRLFSILVDILSSNVLANKLRIREIISENFKQNADSYRTSKRMNVHLVAISWLKAHEEIVSWNRVENLTRSILKCQAYIHPLLVDLKTGAILDGHHRYHVGKNLGLCSVPAVLVDYLNDESIAVDVWPNCGIKKLTKSHVIEMSLSDNVYPPKTSRHKMSDNLPLVSIPLTELRNNSKGPSRIDHEPYNY